ncbi:MAG: alpha-xylosidase, partial [Lachnospiraceae bacterium]|nr:alpha-xylosidase [Lachnospiraceae bacterium]
MRITDDLWNRNPVGRPENTIQGETWRFTLLTDRLIRMEYQEDGQFEDRPSQVVWNRYFETVPYRVTEKKAENDAAGGFEVYTERMHVSYDGMPFSGNGLSVKAAGGLHPYGTAWRYGDVSGNGTLFGNLGGTARTLDEVNGACKLEDGILSLSGCALLKDSSSLVLTEDGWIEPRKCDGIDMYLFVYGCDYKEALRDFYRLTGETPMLPRYALGNWWSRYYAYSEETYMGLI